MNRGYNKETESCKLYTFGARPGVLMNMYIVS